VAQSTLHAMLGVGLAAAAVVLAAGCASPESGCRQGCTYTVVGSVFIQGPAADGCVISRAPHALRIHAVRDGAVVAGYDYTPTSEYVFNIGSEPFQLTADVDGHPAALNVVPKRTSGTATTADLVVPAPGCAPAASNQVSAS
jgi:hypothetical protein